MGCALPTLSGAQIARDAWADAWTLPDDLSVSEWADENRGLPKEGSAESGQWRTARSPHLREIMDALSETSPVKSVVIKKCTQSGGTEVGGNWLGSVIDRAPCAFMVIQPTTKLGQRWSKQRFDGMVSCTPTLKRIIAPQRSRDSENSVDYKKFPGGVLAIAGANSSNDLSSMPIKYIFADEVSKWPRDLDGQGSPLDQARARSSSYARRKELLVSSPVIKDACVISAEYDDSDQSHAYVPCPHCNHKQSLRMDNLTDYGTYVCEHSDCGQEIEEHHKPWMFERLEWRATYPERSKTKRGFHIIALLIPLGLGFSWAEIAEKRIKSKDDPAKEKVFVNTIEGEPYESKEGRLDDGELAETFNDSHYSMRQIPDGVLMLTAGVDVQIDRFHIHLWGWGRNEKCWLIDRMELPALPTDPESWKELETFLDNHIVNSYGIPMLPEVTMIDSGNWTQECYNAIRPRAHKNWYAIKGGKEVNRGVIGRPSLQDVNVNGRIIKKGLGLYVLGVTVIKETLLARLAACIGQEDNARRRVVLPSDIPGEFFVQITSEVRDPESGRYIKLKGRRNEDLDCWGYAYSGACHSRLRLPQLRESDWLKRERKYQPLTQDLFGSANQVTPPITKTQPIPAAPVENHGGFGSSEWGSRL